MKQLLLFIPLVFSISIFAGNNDKKDDISIGSNEKPTSSSEPKEKEHPHNPAQERRDQLENSSGVAVKISF